MIHPSNLKLAFVIGLAIALSPGDAMTRSFGILDPNWLPPVSPATAGLPPAPDTGTPEGQRIPGGTRPEVTQACKQTNQPLTALVPKNGKGLTTAEHPILWFYVPYTREEVHSIEFSLHNRDETVTLYRTSLQPAKTPGVISVALPNTPQHSLKLDQNYHWYFIVNCKPTGFETALVLDGWVTRVGQSPKVERLSNIIWYDELTNLAKRYQAEPQNTAAKNAWVTLLSSVELERLAPAPLVDSDVKQGRGK